MKLKEVLNTISTGNKKSNLLQAKSGNDFENRILEALTEGGDFVLINKEKWKEKHPQKYSKLKDLTQNMNNDKPNIKNQQFKELTKGRNVIIKQPFGTQQYPDFLLLTNHFIIPLEIKYSRLAALKPVWNSGLPRSGGVYIFGNYNLGLTYFLGDQLIKPKERKLLVSIFDKATENLNTLIENNEKDLESIGFDLYLRRMYNQKIALFDEKKSKREKDALKTITYIEDFTTVKKGNIIK